MVGVVSYIFTLIKACTSSWNLIAPMELQRLRKRAMVDENHEDLPPMKKQRIEAPTVTLEDTNEKEDRFMAIEKLISKQWRSKAKILLDHLSAQGMKLNKFNQIIYDDGVGTSLIDNVLYTIAPSNMSTKKPKDYSKFLSFLEQTGAPSSIFGKGKGENSKSDVVDDLSQKIDEWMKF